ncbi:PEP/pyruvate-binding domain-containing protein [Streptomyces rimosus]|uniref:PEP/pyruvate-binding domain-containing protein n=1 Tax=Streptomyces rimosus TaxID=1927 RepID=UPI0037D4BA2B
MLEMAEGQADGLRFGTKAETLKRLSTKLRNAVVPPLVYFTVGEWRRNPDAVCGEIRARPWARKPLAVRSSALCEDGDGVSNAGRFTSCLGVRLGPELSRAIETVIDSFGESHDGDQVLVQPQLTDTVASGVCSSCEPSTGAPYRLVNWSQGSDTTVVTSGLPGIHTWHFLAQKDARPPVHHLASLPALAEELETLVGDSPFEFEFAVAADLTLMLLQVRRLAAPTAAIPRRAHQAAVQRIQQQVSALRSHRPPAVGSDTLLGVMPDWNPAEMIGLRPRPLALSLYRRLITDDTWAESRRLYGYCPAHWRNGLRID